MFFTLYAAEDGSTFNEYLSVITACILSFLSGIHAGWTSPYIPKLLNSEDYPFKISNEAASYIAIFGPIGDVFGAVLSMVLVDRIGRRNSLIILGTPMLFSSLLIYFSYLSPAFLYIARLCGGISFGTVSSIITMYNSEISRPSIRGKSGVIVVFLYTPGVIVVNVFGNYFTMYEMAIFSAAVSVFFLYTFLQIPETPYYLLMKGKLEAAEKSLRFFRRIQNVEEELQILILVVQRQLSESRKFKDIFVIEHNRRALSLMFFGRIIQQMTGGMAFLMYAQYLLAESSDFMQPQFAVLVISLLQTFVTPFCGYCADRFGRVPLLTFPTAACSVCLILLGVYFSLKDYPNLSLPVFCPVLFLGLFFINYQFGLCSILSIVLGELFSTLLNQKPFVLST
ncbi:hypothetical protein WA026_011194 [Henosepilachna vigintioctopunctata]|uniref:Major facilitator superfamily (MFS) profile domain-containing protein n=1 Tax=Henosepilachna vigintioctopunctata TaxID=420089 RepID=A0AAW1TWW9_9CUCU